MNHAQPTPAHPPADDNHLRGPNPSRWGKLGNIFRGLSISQKIGCGYAIALSISVLGTSLGLYLGNRYEHQVQNDAEHGHHMGVLINQTQVSVLEARSHQQQLVAVLQSPAIFQQEYHHVLRHLDEIQALIFQMRGAEYATALTGFEESLTAYDRDIKTYLQDLEALIRQTNPDTLQPENFADAQRKLLEFNSSESALRLAQISDELLAFAQGSFEREEAADLTLDQAQRLEVSIITFSILCSVAIASLLAILTSRAIARPIQQVTQVARQVTEDSDFYLKAPVTTTDEVGVLATSLNQLIRRMRNLLEEQKAESARQLIQNEKMSSLGCMMAGIAHEINNPVNFIYGNLEHTSGYFDDLLALLAAYEAKLPESQIQQQAEEIDLEFLKQDLPKILNSMKVGADRARQIVLSLKNFSRLDETEIHSVDLHAYIDSTLLILNNRIKQGITVECNYDNLPLIEGYGGSLYQVIMNILSNAIDALEQIGTTAISEVEPETPALERSPRIIKITTRRLEQNWVSLQIADNGPGIPKELQDKIFETFFTTKPIGVGTGLGLAISHQIVTEKHGGKLGLESELGQGTTFTIALPIQHFSKPQPTTHLPEFANA